MPCESIAYNLKRLGYGTHALHNHTATFYDRNVAYANLGFDSFTPVEMMTDVRYNQLGWECDDVLTGEILSALDSTDGSDYVFGVTVQGHGNTRASRSMKMSLSRADTISMARSRTIS